MGKQQIVEMLSKAKAKAYINAPQNESHSVSQQWPEPIKRNTLPRPSFPFPFPLLQIPIPQLLA